MEASFEAMVQTSTWLGNIIGDALAVAVKGKTSSESPDEKPVAKESLGKAKGALIACERPGALGISSTSSHDCNCVTALVSRKTFLMARHSLPKLFEEFRGFSVVAALNRFQYLTSAKAPSVTATTTSATNP